MKTMALADIKDVTAAVKKMTAATKATGPRTERGKLRASLNATRHGLSGRGLLLPGEDKAEYESRLDGIFTAMAPQNDAEAELVALVGDDIHKLNRLGKIEQGVTLGRIEELLGTTAAAERAGVIGNAIQALGAALTTWPVEPIPTERNSEFQRRFDDMVTAINLVEAAVVGLPADLIETCNDLVARLHGTKGDSVVDQAAYARLFEVARQVMGLLLDRGHAEEAAQEGLRVAIAGIALPDEAELRKLGRYRAMLEVSLQRRLAALDQLRKLTAGTVVNVTDREKAVAYRVALRVVA